MKTNLQKAKELLQTGEYTCVLCQGDTVFTSTERGVAPLVNWLSSGMDFHGFGAADKIVGRAAAFLYSLLGVDEVYASVMSEEAESLLLQLQISPSYEVKTEYIINRAGTGGCPMGQAVKGITEPAQALEAVRKKMKELSR